MSAKTYNLTMGGFTYKDCRFVFGRYGNGTLAIEIDSDEGPVGKATVNMGQTPAEGCVWIKDYSENEGIAKSLAGYGLIEPTGRVERSGFVEVAEYRLTGDWANAAV